jgi:hypothetical protein
MPMGTTIRKGRRIFLFKIIIPKIKDIRIKESLMSTLNPLSNEIIPKTKNVSRNDSKIVPKIECVKPL